MRLALVCFYCLCVFVYVLYFIATMSFAGYILSVLFCMLSMLISDSRFDLVWFRLSCDHGWIRSGSVNVRKQQQQQQQYCCLYWFVYQVPVYFLFGGMYIRTRFTVVYAYMCNYYYSGMYVELVYMYDHHNWARLPILLAVS